jgi:hypothetical protein
MTRKTLDERIRKRDACAKWTTRGQICVELDRLARQIRKLPTTIGQFYSEETCVRWGDVLDLIRQAKR